MTALNTRRDLIIHAKGIVARADFLEDDIEEKLEKLSLLKNVRGVRYLLNWHDNLSYRFCGRGDLLTDKKWRKGFSLLEKFNFSFDLHLYYHQFEDATDLARTFPNIQLILNHAGCPVDRDEASTEKWKAAMLKLAEQPNIAAKISGLSMYDHNGTFESFQPYILHTIKSFGVKRCMFASNFPVGKINISYSNLYHIFKRAVEHLPLDQQLLLFSSNAIKFYRLPPLFKPSSSRSSSTTL